MGHSMGVSPPRSSARDGVEGVTLYAAPVHRRGEQTMARDADEPGQPLLLRLDGRLGVTVEDQHEDMGQELQALGYSDEQIPSWVA